MPYQISEPIDIPRLQQVLDALEADISERFSIPAEISRNVNILVHAAALVHRSSRDLSRENYFKVLRNRVIIRAQRNHWFLQVKDPRKQQTHLFPLIISVNSRLS